MAVVSALISMGGGLAAIFADYFEKSPSGKQITSAQEYGKLVEIRGAVERMRARVARETVSKMPDQELELNWRTLDSFAGEIVSLAYR
jgi:hypothetical protein